MSRRDGSLCTSSRCAVSVKLLGTRLSSVTMRRCAGDRYKPLGRFLSDMKRCIERCDTVDQEVVSLGQVILWLRCTYLATFSGLSVCGMWRHCATARNKPHITGLDPRALAHQITLPRYLPCVMHTQWIVVHVEDRV